MSETLTIPSNDRVERLLAAAGQTVFSYDFPVYAGADIEVRRFRAEVQTLLVNGADYTVDGVGTQGGGTITLATPAQAGDLLVIRSAQPVARGTTFNNGGDLPAQSLNAELNRIFIAFQQLQASLAQALRLPTSDPVQAAELATAAARANALLGFNAAGAVELVSRVSVGGGAFQQLGTGAVVRTVQDELRQDVTPRQFGAVGDGVADDTLAVQRAANQAAAVGAFLVVTPGNYRTTDTITVPGPAAGVIMQGVLTYAGPAGRAALVLGDGGAARNANKQYLGLRVQRATLSTWTDEADVGIRIINSDSCFIEVLQAERFTIGVQTVGDGRGFEDSWLLLGRIVDNRYGLDVRTLQVGGWNNAIRYFGGHFANSSSSHPTLSRFGVRFSAAPGAYVLHNHHLFLGPAFELQRQGTPGTVDAIPFLIEVDGRALNAIGIRMEACSPIVARHTSEFSDALYEVDFVGTYAYLGAAIDYTATAKRAGASVRNAHQALAAQATPRLIAAADNLRARAFQWAPGSIGLDEMGVVSITPGGSPTNLTGYVFPGLDDIDLGGNFLGLPGSRCIGFVVRTDLCKEFFIAVDADEVRPMVMQFNASENILTSPTARALFSNTDTDWVAAPSNWWQTNSFNDALSPVITGFPISRLQRVTVDAACALAFIGIRGNGIPGAATGIARALRIYCPAEFSPAVLWGGARSWGRRELTGISVGFDPASIAAGATQAFNVAVPGARPGDFAQAGFGLATTLPFLAQAQTDQVNVRIWNPTAAAVNLDPANVTARVVKPRV